MASKNAMSGITGTSYEQGISLPNTSRTYSLGSSYDTAKQMAGIPIYDISNGS
jgi:hypothetical protein